MPDHPLEVMVQAWLAEDGGSPVWELLNVGMCPGGSFWLSPEGTPADGPDASPWGGSHRVTGF